MIAKLSIINNIKVEKVNYFNLIEKFLYLAIKMNPCWEDTNLLKYNINIINIFFLKILMLLKEKNLSPIRL